MILEDILTGTPGTITEAILEVAPEVTITQGATREATLEVLVREVTQEATIPVSLIPVATDLNTEASLAGLLNPVDVSPDIVKLAASLGITLEEAQAQIMQGIILL